MKTIHFRRRGFTLIEVLVALAITVIIVMVLVTVTSAALDGWRTSRNEVRATRQAKAAMEIINRDLEGLVMRSGNIYQWLDIKATAGAALPGPANHRSANAAKMIFLTAATDRYDGGGGLGDISAVVYELEYQDPIDAANQFPTFALYRRLINPDETFASLLSQANLTAPPVAQASATARANFVCENIHQFTMTFIIQTAATGVAATTKRVVVQSNGAVDSFKVFGDRLEVQGAIDAGRLRGVEVSLSVLTDSALQTLKAGGVNPAKQGEFLARNSYQFSKTIDIPQP